MYDNPLIFGKDTRTNIVSVEADGSNLVIFKEVNGNVESEVIPNKYWLITNKKVSSKQTELKGEQYYKYLATFDDLEAQRKARQSCKKARIDFYDIWDLKESALVFNGMTYFKGLNPKDVSILFFDIETTGLVHNKDSKVLLISNTFRKNGKIIKKLFAYDEYKNDADMLESWCRWVREIDPSIMCGHNILGYDLPYIQHCADLNDTSLKLGRDKSEIKFNPYTSKKRKDGSQDIEYYNCYVWGREIVDTMFLSITYDVGRKYESYGLKAIIKHEGLEKKNRVFYDAGEIRYKYKDPKEWKLIKEYARDDADDAMSLFDLMIPAIFYFTQSVSKSFQMMVNSSSGGQINNIMVRSYLQDNHSIAKADEITHSIKGGISFAIPNIYRQIMKIDLKSAYPSQILRFKLYDPKKDPNQNFYKLVHYFTHQRFDLKELYNETKDSYYKDREQSGKIFINSAYGSLTTPGLNYNCMWIGAKITEETRNVIDIALKWASGKDKDYWINEFTQKTNK